MDYEEATITEEDRSSTKPEDIERCLKAGVLSKFYEHTIMEIEVQEQNQVSCFIRNDNDTVTCPMGCTLTRVRTYKGGSVSYQNRLACRQCPNRCTSRNDYKVVKFGPSTKYVPVLMYGTTQQPLQVYPPWYHLTVPKGCSERHKRSFWVGISSRICKTTFFLLCRSRREKAL